MLAIESRDRYAPDAGRGFCVPAASMRSSLRAAVHSRINSSKKNGMANSTGSRICEGSANQNPVKVSTQVYYDLRPDGQRVDPLTFVRQAVHTVADDSDEYPSAQTLPAGPG